MTWEPGEFLIAQTDGVHTRTGYVYRDLALFIDRPAIGRRPPQWSLTHLGSGLQVAFIKGRVAAVFPIASKIAECSDWDFDGPDGWRNRDPDLGVKVANILSRHKNAGVNAHGEHAHDLVRKVAREIAERRAGGVA